VNVGRGGECGNVRENSCGCIVDGVQVTVEEQFIIYHKGKRGDVWAQGEKGVQDLNSVSKGGRDGKGRRLENRIV
jgi:hypothetical protein